MADQLHRQPPEPATADDQCRVSKDDSSAQNGDGRSAACPASRAEPNAGARMPELCPYQLNNRLGWANCAHTLSCPTSHVTQSSAPSWHFRVCNGRQMAVSLPP